MYLSVTARIRASLNQKLGCTKLHNKLHFIRNALPEIELRKKRNKKVLCFTPRNSVTSKEWEFNLHCRNLSVRGKRGDGEWSWGKKKKRKEEEKWSEANCQKSIWWQYDITWDCCIQACSWLRAYRGCYFLQGRSSNLGQDSEVKVAYCSNNLTHWGRSGSFKLFKRPFPGFLTILTL